MKATFLQLQFIEDIEKNFNIKYIDYGFYSDGSIGVLCKDQFSEFSITVFPNGKTIKN
jgi:hypothetical protein